MASGLYRKGLGGDCRMICSGITDVLVKLGSVHLSALRVSGHLTCSRGNFMQVGFNIPPK